MDTLISAAENRDMFARVAPKYDRMNRFISVGLDSHWRSAAVTAMKPVGSGKYLDLGCGTADLCIDLAQAQPGASLVGIDPVKEMLELGRLKVRKLCLSASVELMLGDALDLPFDNSTFQGIVSGFCLRNITDRKKAFAEMYRTLAVAGRLVILELGVPNNALLRLFHGIHGRCIVPVAARLAGLSNAYNYLMDSIDEFAAPSKVVEEIQAAGFSDASFRPLSGGIVNLFIGEKG